MTRPIEHEIVTRLGAAEAQRHVRLEGTIRKGCGRSSASGTRSRDPQGQALPRVSLNLRGLLPRAMGRSSCGRLHIE